MMGSSSACQSLSQCCAAITDASVQATCNATVSGGDATICAGALTLYEATSGAQGCSSFVACDAVTQKGCGACEKCTVQANGSSLKEACVAAGTVAEGQPCAVDSSGNDDCAAGLVCTDVGIGDFDPNAPKTVCQPLCHGDADCKNGAKCAVDSLTGTPSSDVGVCVMPCTPGSCTGNTTCGTVYLSFPLAPAGNGTNAGFLGCRLQGTAGPWQPCNVDQDCGADSWCLSTCDPLCDATHACGDGGVPPAPACTTQAYFNIVACDEPNCAAAATSTACFECFDSMFPAAIPELTPLAVELNGCPSTCAGSCGASCTIATADCFDCLIETAVAGGNYINNALYCTSSDPPNSNCQEFISQNAAQSAPDGCVR